MYETGRGKELFSKYQNYAKLEPVHKDVHENIANAHKIMVEHGKTKRIKELKVKFNKI